LGKAVGARPEWLRGRRLFLVNFVLILIPLTYLGYKPLLRYTPKILMMNNQPQPADAIVVLAGGEPGRALGAVDLYRAKMARYVVVTTEEPPLPPAELQDLQQQGIVLVQSYENYVRILQGMGVPAGNIIRIESYVEDTFDELKKVRELCEKRHWTNVLVVTSNYHSRRAQLAADYVLGPSIHAVVITSKYGGISTDDWWTHAGHVRTFLIEFQKLVAYTFYIWPRMVWTKQSDTIPSNTSSVLPGFFSTPRSWFTS
jgi:uncharacterized SAM-binding protein YcdF (DUF218 family)